MIKIEHISKQYKIGVSMTYTTLKDSFTAAFKFPLSRELRKVQQEVLAHTGQHYDHDK